MNASHAPSHPPPARRRQRGTTLLEGLVALLVLSLGMFSVGRVQTQLRLNADMARQRSEAVRLAQEDLERLRAFSVVAATAGARAYADIVDATRTVDGPTRYEVSRSVVAAQAPNAKNASVTVSWADRGGTAHQVVLNSVIGGSNPAYSGALSVAPAAAAMQPVNARSPRIPLVAKDLGNGTSAFKPAREGTVALLLNNTTGEVSGRCNGVSAALSTAELTAANLGACDARVGQLLSGVVRFSTSGPPLAGQAFEAPAAVAVALTLTGGTYPAPPWCGTDVAQTAAGDRHVAYHCVVYPRASGGWSGRSTLTPTGWTLGSTADDRRVCRYTADLNASGAIDTNAEHPAAYANVDGPLAHQNFLVIRGNEACPGGTPVQLDGAGALIYANLATAPHQP